MSTHLLIAAAYLEGLPQGRKLVLMAIADSADEHSCESAPGLPKLRAWSGLGKSAALDAVAQLAKPVDQGGDGLIERIEAGRLGRRATYRVFPHGVPAIPHPSEVAARYLPAGSEQPDPPVIPKDGDNPAQEGPASRTLGSGNPPSRVRPAGPLHASTSVSIAPQPPPPPVETRRPAPPASGFPGARSTNRDDDPAAVARRARGANDVPCPFHAGMIVPCGRCAHEAAKVPEEDRLARLAALRATARNAVAAPTDSPADTAQEPPA
jgi:hypothetical protein